MPKKPKPADPKSVEFSIAMLRRIPDDSLGRLAIDAIDNIRYAHPKEVRVGYYGLTAEKQFGKWLSSLDAKAFVGFFAATSWPPPKAEKEKPKAPAPAKTGKKSPGAQLAANRRKAKSDRAKARKTALANPGGPRSGGAMKPSNGAARQRPLWDAHDEDEDLADDFAATTPAAAPTPTPAAAPTPAKGPPAPGTPRGGSFAKNRTKVVDYLKSRPSAQAADVQGACSLSAGQTKGILKRLRESGVVTVSGDRKSARYSLAPTNGASAHL